MPMGKTPIFHMTIHNIAKMVNQDKRAVCNKVNFFERINMTLAKPKPQIIHITPFMGVSGKFIPLL
jgi:hypothetical protein